MDTTRWSRHDPPAGGLRAAVALVFAGSRRRAAAGTCTAPAPPPRRRGAGAAEAGAASSAGKPAHAAQAKAQAQKLTLDSITPLQNGESRGLAQILEQALTLDPTERSRAEMRIRSRRTRTRNSGPSFSGRHGPARRFAVEDRPAVHGRSLQVPHPREVQRHRQSEPLAAGQTGDQGAGPGSSAGWPPPPRRRVPRRPCARQMPDESTKATAIEAATPRSASVTLMEQGTGHAEGRQHRRRLRCVSRGGTARSRQPRRRTATRRTAPALARRYEREATQAFQRQNLDEAIGKWDRVLALEPGNQKAKLERERAELDLRKKLNEKFGAK